MGAADMPRRHRRRRCRELVAADLDLMPMLNVFLAIIPLLLLSAAFIPVSIIPASLPGRSMDGGTSKPERHTTVEIVVREEAYLVRVDGATAKTIGRGAAGSAATAELASTLKAIATSHPGARELQIASEPGTRYEEIIQVMDVSRAAGLPEAALVEAGEGP